VWGSKPFARRVLDGLLAVLCWVAGLEWLMAIVAAPLLVFPTVRPLWTAGALALLVILWLLRWMVRREPWPVTPFNGALLLFALMVPVGIWASAVPEVTAPEAVRVLLGLIAFRAVSFAVRDRRGLALAVLAFCLLGALITTVGLLGARWSAKVPVLGALGGRVPHLIETLPEDQGTPGVNPNHLAGMLTLYLPLALALVVGWPLARRVTAGPAAALLPSLAFLALVAGTLLLTQSRSGWMGGAAGVLALVTLAGLTARSRWARAIGVLALLLTVAGVVSAGVWVAREGLAGVLEAVGAPEGVETAVGTISMSGRLEIWSRALYAIQDFPFTGCGLGAFRRIVHVLYPLFRIGPDADIGHAHNIFLQTALDLGIPGLIAYLALLLVAGAVCWRWARRGDRLARPLALGLMAGLIGLHAYGLTDAVALGSKPVVTFWFALGLVACLDRVPDLEARALAEEGTARKPRERPRPRLWATAVALAVLVALGAVGIWAVRLAWETGGLPGAAPRARLPVYPAAAEVDVRTQSPPAGSDWKGLLEITTFTTTHPLSDVVAFYSATLVEGGWEVDVESGDGTSWGGVYTRDGGRTVCLLNLFEIEGEVWGSVLCGERVEPLERFPRLPLPSPETGE